MNPGLLHRTGRSDRHAGGCQKPGIPADRSFRRTTRTASADSEVRPDPGPDHTPATSQSSRSTAGSTIHTLPADSVRARNRAARTVRCAQSSQFWLVVSQTPCLIAAKSEPMQGGCTHSVSSLPGRPGGGVIAGSPAAPAPTPRLSSLVRPQSRASVRVVPGPLTGRMTAI